jgi:zinc transport system permease protein
VAVLVLAIGLAPQLFAVSQDEEFARVSGLPVRVLNVMIAVLAAVTVAVAMRTVGLLLVSALMVVPVATSQQLTTSFRATFSLALVLGVVPSVGGVLFSYQVSVAPGASIVVLALLGFVVAWPVGSWLRRRRRRSENGEDPRLTGEHVMADENHGHRHGPDCEHVAVRHGDHEDYVHGGHLHARHGDHYDEH